VPNPNVDTSTIWRVVQLFKNSGSVEKRQHSQSKSFNKLTPSLELTILHFVLLNSGTYLWEIQEYLYESTEAEVTPSAMTISSGSLIVQFIVEYKITS